jgi:hypothetical protein
MDAREPVQITADVTGGAENRENLTRNRRGAIGLAGQGSSLRSRAKLRALASRCQLALLERGTGENFHQ